MEEIKLSQQISLMKFVCKGMMKVSKTVDNFIELHKIYNTNKGKIIKFNNSRFIFEGSEFSLKHKVVRQDKMKISLIACIGRNNELGLNNDLIWKIKEDLKRFKELTKGHFILMGRKTFESLPGVLPGRIHIVISSTMRQPLESDRVFVFKSIDEAINWVNTNKSLFESMNQDKLYVIGGGEIYKQTIDIADELELTCVKNYVLEADVFFPVIDMNKFQIHYNHPSEENTLIYVFRTLRRIYNRQTDEMSLNKSIINNILVTQLTKDLQ